MARSLTSEMQSEVVKSLIRPAWIVRLDIDTDPVYAWTGRGPFSPTGTGDAALDGNTFLGLGNIGSVSSIKDTNKGSDAVTLTLAGVDPESEALQQIVTDHRLWQYRQGWIWVGLIDEEHEVVINPTRVKTGRIDQLKIDGDGEEGNVTVSLESHQTYVSEPLNSRYSEQADIDPNDTSQKAIHRLANMTPNLRQKNGADDTGLRGIVGILRRELTGQTLPWYGRGKPQI